ncbi:uncharacterized protein [Pyxicephalus adspersus]|uniref:uncharacterized protein n=1 Tax=Pyxicephalus adspersus TaxID=30357 RepID=UPI003B5B68AF
MPGCFIKGCSFSWRQKDPKITLHVFPRDPEMIRKWLLQIYRKDEGLEEFVEKIQTSKKGVYRICSRHFAANCYEKKRFGKVFRKDAIPTIFPWVEPYPLEEQRVDHPYAKKRKLDKEEPEEYEDAPAEETTEQPAPSASTSVLTPKEFVMSQFASKILTRTFPEFPPSQNNVTEEVTSSTSSCPSVQEVGYYGLPPPPRQKRYYRPRARRTVGTMTRRYPGMSHKSIQIDRPIGMKDKSAQIFRRPPHRSIALQCNLAKLPALTHAGKPQLTKPVIEKLDDLYTNPSTASFADFVETSMIVQVIEEEEEPASPGVSSIESSEDTASDMEPEETSILDLDETHSPCVEVEEECSQEINENIRMDPKDADISPIFLPENQDLEDHVKERKFIVFESCLNKLLRCCKCLGLANCTGNIAKLKKYRIGSAVLVTAICSLKHEFHLWTSQPMIGRMPVGNLLISSSALCSGNNFLKVDCFFRLAGILGISQLTHNSNQNLYLFPTIDHHWKLEKKKIIRDLQSKPIALVSDGQSKVYASRAKCCTYNFLEYHTKKLIEFQVEASEPPDVLKSLEKKTFRAALDRLIKEKLNVRVICTDRHAGLKKLLKKHYSPIKHQYDVWHVANSVGNKMTEASRKHECSQLARWIGPAKSHLWWSVRTCNHNPKLLKEKWISFAHHAANQHQWEGSILFDSCHHKEEEEEDDIEWLQAGSEAHLQLKDIVLEENLLQDLNHISNFCHAEELEVLHSITQKYHVKRTRYSLDGMVARSQLAALDYNQNIGRIQDMINNAALYDDEGGWCTNGKAKKDWVECKIYNPASQDFMKDIIADVLLFADGKKNFSWVSQRSEVSRKITAIQSPARSEMLNTFIYRVPQLV